MKKISSIKTKFQSFLDWVLFIFRLGFDLIPEAKPRPNICHDGFLNKDRQLLKRAAFNFELKKRGAR